MDQNSPKNSTYSLLLDGKGKATIQDISFLDGWDSQSETLWLHFNLEDMEAKKWLKEESGLENIAVEALLEVESRPRLSPVGDAALLAFRGVNFNPGATPDDMIGIRIWLEKDRIISSYRRKLHSVEDIFDALNKGDGPKTPAEVVTSLADRLVLRMSDTVDSLGEQIDDLEEKMLEGDSSDTRFSLANLRRQIIALRRYMAPQREALSALISSKFSWMSDEHRLSLRETNDHLIRHLEDLDAIRERAAVTHEEQQSRLAEKQNLRMYVLSIVTAVFLPLGFLTGLLGINVGGIPGSDNPSAFGFFALFLFLLVVFQVLFFRYRKWF